MAGSPVFAGTPSSAVYGRTILPLEKKSHSTLRHMVHIQVYSSLGAIGFSLFFLYLPNFYLVLYHRYWAWKTFGGAESFREKPSGTSVHTEHLSFNTVKALCIVGQLPEESYGAGPPQLNEKKEGKKKNIVPSAQAAGGTLFLVFPGKAIMRLSKGLGPTILKRVDA